jgi:hypothetical protein
MLGIEVSVMICLIEPFLAGRRNFDERPFVSSSTEGLMG